MLISKIIESVETTSRKKKKDSLYSGMAIQLRMIYTMKMTMRIM